MTPEFSVQKIREFVARGYQSVAARFAKSALQHIDSMHALPPGKYLVYEFSGEPPKIGDRIIKIHLPGDDKVGDIKTLVGPETEYHIGCSDGSGYSKIGQHGWKKLVQVEIKEFQ